MLENWDCRLTAIRNRAVSTSQSCIVYRTTFSFSALSMTTRIQHNKTVWDSTNSNAKSTSLRCSGQRECNLSVWSRTSQNQLIGADIAAYCQRSPEKNRVNFSALSGTDCSHTAYFLWLYGHCLLPISLRRSIHVQSMPVSVLIFLKNTVNVKRLLLYFLYSTFIYNPRLRENVKMICSVLQRTR